MTPKEKAKELVDKYKNLTTYKYQEYAGARYSTFEHDINIIKQCALVCCDEILNTEVGDGVESYKYWEQVKKELELL